ncbi:MAG: pilus assembly protein TadG-related protein [Gemmatimonadota bacterium]
MSQMIHRFIRDRKGSVLVIVALGMPVLIGMAGLAIDVGALFVVRSELQRAADAGSLAGASAFLDFPKDRAAPVATQRARDFTLNQVSREVSLRPEEINIQVDPANELVRVTISRANNETFFAKIFGVHTVPIQSAAAAQTAPGGTNIACVKPFALPDRWMESISDDGNRIWDPWESWQYDPEGGDQYESYDWEDPTSTTATGYGSDWAYDVNSDHKGDYGRLLTIKASQDNVDPADAPVDSFFFPWIIPDEEGRVGDESCAEANGESGARPYRANICQCNLTPVFIGEEYETENGDMEGPTIKGVNDLYDQDPTAFWDGHVVRSDYGLNAGPRVITIGVFDPSEYLKPGKSTIAFNNFVRVFIDERMAGEAEPVRARIIGPGIGNSFSDVGGGSLVKVLRLVE